MTSKIIIFSRALAGIVILISIQSCCQKEDAYTISEAFEFRYVTENTDANGITDFKGPTAVFDTAQRIEYLKKFAEYGARFFNDTGLNTQVIDEKELAAGIKKLKSRPQPEIRSEIALDNWKYLGYKQGQRQQELQQIDEWKSFAGTSIKDHKLMLTSNTISKTFAEQDWRMKFSWTIMPLEKKQNVNFSFSEVAKVGLNEQGTFYFVTDQKKVETIDYSPDRLYNLKVEIDLESGKYNFYVNDSLVADFVSVSEMKETVDRFTITSAGSIMLDNIWGVGYDCHKEGSRRYPYFINTFIDQDFIARPSPKGFELKGYDDSEWETVPYRRYAHGGERTRDEALYLRKRVNVDDFDCARLRIETVRPSGEIYVNGEFIEAVGRVPKTLNISDHLKAGENNLIAVKVNPYKVPEVNYHMSTDRWSSWFAGLMTLELTAKTYIDDVFVYTSAIDKDAEEKLHINLCSERDTGFSGRLVTKFYPWYPEAHDTVAAQSIKSVQLNNCSSKNIIETITINRPDLWTTDSPNLYKVRVELQDKTGNAIDDYVVTTGIRTISQEGGTFRINGKPEVLYGPLVFNQSYPLERVSQWMFSPPKRRWVETILEIKKMNGNAIRMSVHDKRIAGANDKRLAHIGDQLGIMFMWQTPCWIRQGSVKDFNFNAVPDYVNAVQNSPSIVIWQPSNHPFDFSPEWYGLVLRTFAESDPSRMVSPAAHLRYMEIDEWPGDTEKKIPGWLHPQLARGSMEQILGYGADWDILRKLGTRTDSIVGYVKDKTRHAYLTSNTHAWFDYESEETIGQPNWKLYKGKPYYHMYSYEKDYDKGSIGRVLTFSEWMESQAWQALSAYESYRKKRWLDYDGMNWCPLRGGPNTATYMKPVIGYEGYAKLGFYALQMVYQPVLAGSKNVDLAYGPEDEIPLIIMNRGTSKVVDVTVVVRSVKGKPVAQKTFRDIKLKEGRTITDIGIWKPKIITGKYYGFEYIVKQSGSK